MDREGESTGEGMQLQTSRSRGLENVSDIPRVARRKTKRETVPLHYNIHERLQPNEQFKLYGFNLEKILYPITRNNYMNVKFERRRRGQFDIPTEIVPKDVTIMDCDHGNRYNHRKKIKTSSNIIVYTDNQDHIFNTPSYGLKTLECTKCVMQADTTQLLLWNLGGGQFVDFLTLHNAIHKMRKGMSVQGYFEARKETLDSIGIKSKLTYTQFRKACDGYMINIDLQPDIFQCYRD